MSSFTHTVNPGPVEEIVLSDSDEEELQPVDPPNLIFVPGNRAGMIDETEVSSEPEVIEEQYPKGFVVIDGPADDADGFDLEQNRLDPSGESILKDVLVNGVPKESVAGDSNGPSVPEAEPFIEGTVPEDPAASSEQPVDVLNPFFCDFEELNKFYFGAGESKEEPKREEPKREELSGQPKRVRPSGRQDLSVLQDYERDVAEAQLRAMGCGPAPKRSKVPKVKARYFNQQLAEDLAAKRKRLEKIRALEASMKECSVRLECLTRDILVKNNASQSSINFFIHKIVYPSVRGKNFPCNNGQKPLNFSNRSNVNGKWSVSSLADRLKIMSDEAFKAMENQMKGLNNNGGVLNVAQMNSNIQTKLSDSIISGSENETIRNINETPETIKVKSQSFGNVSPSHDLNMKTKDLRVQLKDLKTEKNIRIGNSIKPVSEILSEIDLIKAKMKDSSDSSTHPASVISSPYFESSKASGSCTVSRDQSAKSSESTNTHMTTGSAKPRLSVRKDLFASSSSTAPPVVTSPYFVSKGGENDLSAKSDSSAASSKIFNTLSSFKVDLKNKLTSVLTNPTKTHEAPQQSDMTFNSTANGGTASQNIQFENHADSNTASVEQISAFADQLLSFLPKTNRATSSATSQQKQPAFKNTSASGAFLKQDPRDKPIPMGYTSLSTSSAKKNEQESSAFQSNSTHGPSKVSQEIEADWSENSENDSSDGNQAEELVTLCEGTGKVIDESESVSKNNEVKSATEKSSKNASEGQKSQSSNKNSDDAESGPDEDERSTRSKDTINTSSQSQEKGLANEVLCEETSRIINGSESASKSSHTRNSSENVLSNPPDESEESQSFNSDFSTLLNRLDDDLQSARSENTQNTSQSENEDERQKTQGSESPSSSAKRSRQKGTAFRNDGNLESSVENKLEESSVNDHSESLSTASVTTHDESAGPSSRDDSKRRNSRASSVRSNSVTKLYLKDQLNTEKSPEALKKCTIVLENCKVLVSEKLSNRRSSRSLPQPAEEDYPTSSNNTSPVPEKKSRSKLVETRTRSRSPEVQENARSRSPEVHKKTRSKSSEIHEKARSKSPEVQEKAKRNSRSKSSEVQEKARSESPEVQEKTKRNSRCKSSKVQEEARSRSPKLAEETRSVSPEVETTSPEISLARVQKRARSSEDTDECPRKKEKHDSSSSELMKPVIFDLADESFPTISAVIEDILSVDGTFDNESFHEDTTLDNRIIQTRVTKGSYCGTLAQKIFSLKDENSSSRAIFEAEDRTFDLRAFDGSSTCGKTVTDCFSREKEQRCKKTLRSTFAHLQMQLFDFRSTPFNKKILNEFPLDGNLDSETSDDEVLIEKKARLKGKNMSSKAKSRKISRFSIKKQNNTSRNVPESSVGTNCSVILSDFVVEKNLVCVSSNMSSDSKKLDSGQEISEIKSSPNLHSKTDEKLTGRKPVIKVIRLNYDEVKDGISVLDLGRTLSATSRSTSMNRRKQGKPRKYGFNINNRNGGFKSPSKVISDLHFMVRNPKKRSK